MPEVELFLFAIEIGCGDDADKAAVEAHATLPDFEKVEGVAEVIHWFPEDFEETGAD